MSDYRRGLLDTNIMILRRWVDPADLPDEMAISAITLAELSGGPDLVRCGDEQGGYDEHVERARRLDVSQRAEGEFDPIPLGAEAAGMYGRVAAVVVAAGCRPRRRAADLMIAATAVAEDLPLFTANPTTSLGLTTCSPSGRSPGRMCLAATDEALSCPVKTGTGCPCARGGRRQGRLQVLRRARGALLTVDTGSAIRQRRHYSENRPGNPGNGAAA